MLHFIQDTFIPRFLRHRFFEEQRGSTGTYFIKGFKKALHKITANKKAQGFIKGISLQSSSELYNHSVNRQQGIAPIVPKWVDKRQEIAAINELQAI
jgi:hypothetical protein